MSTTTSAGQMPRGIGETTYYGHTVWMLGEDCDEGLMVEGHGRRALAALNAHRRAEEGTGWWGWMTKRTPGVPVLSGLPRIKQVWVLVHTTCGCTVDEHAEHHNPERGTYCADNCARPELPPCDPERFVWSAQAATADTPGALPMTEVRW